MKQIPLFLDQNILINTADTDLVALRLEKALAGYRTYTDLYGSGAGVERKCKLAEHLLSGLAGIQYAQKDFSDDVCALWDSFITYAQDLGFRKESLPSAVKKPFFEHATQALTQYHADNLSLVGIFFPAGYVYMQAGDYGKAVDALRARIAKSRHNARFWGYLGDAQYLLGNITASGRCFFQAFLLESAALDWQHLQHGDLLSLQQELEENDGRRPDTAIWIATHAYLRGIIRPGILEDKNELAALVRRYCELERAYLQHHDASTAADIFLIAIALCDSRILLDRIKGIEFANIRRRMKELNPELFAAYMDFKSKK